MRVPDCVCGELWLRGDVDEAELGGTGGPDGFIDEQVRDERGGSAGGAIAISVDWVPEVVLKDISDCLLRGHS